jgi:HD-GYP domain-containing protein (c-di-GMP phosphodiesterase class II)
VRRKHLATIAALSRSMEAKDDYTGGHTERVSDVAVALGKRLGFTGEELDAIEVGALLHDIGKIGIPERILHKPGSLDEDEWKVMKEHPLISEHILSGIELSPIVLQIARSSHERIDGKGYPDHLVGDEIPLPARIVLVADAWDALTSDRPYRRGRPISAAIEEIRAHTGPQFCPKVVAALERIYREEPHLLGAVHLRAVEAGAA